MLCVRIRIGYMIGGEMLLVADETSMIMFSSVDVSTVEGFNFFLLVGKLVL